MLYILRHGQTDWNVLKKLQGQTDIPLNEAGRAMAAEAGRRYADIHLDVCFCSPLVRARETAALFLTGRDVPVRCDERLREMRFGACEGAENAAEHPECPAWAFFRDPERYRPAEGGETFDALYARTGGFLAEVVDPLLAEDRDVLIVGHGAMNASIINRVRGIPLSRFWESVTPNCELVRLK